MVAVRLPDRERLRGDAATLGVALGAAEADAVLAFGERLLHWNRTFNLISRKDEDRLYERHLLDALSVVPWIPPGHIMDLGTGPGLPGIPLAIACPANRFTLIDRNARRIRFVTQTLQALGLTNAEARCGAVPEVAELAAYDAVVSRAVAAPAEAFALACPALRPGGRLLIMASAQRRPVEPPVGPADLTAPPPALPPGARWVSIERLCIPGLEQPHGLLILQREPTDPAALGGRPQIV